MGLLCSRSRLQQRFEMSVNVCPDDIFWIIEDFVTKFGMVMQHHQPVSCKICFVVVAIFKVKVTARAYDGSMTLSSIFSELFDSLATKLGLIVRHYKPECPVENGITVFKVKVTTKVWNVSECLSRWYFLNRRTFCYQIWYGDAPSWARVLPTFCCCYLQGQGNSKGSYDQNMTLSTILSELLISWWPNLVWWYIIKS